MASATAARPPIATGTMGNSGGGIGGSADVGVDGSAVVAEDASGIADGDTFTGFPQLAPGASGGAGSMLDSVIGGVFGQSTE